MLKIVTILIAIMEGFPTLLTHESITLSDMQDFGLQSWEKHILEGENVCMVSIVISTNTVY